MLALPLPSPSGSCQRSRPTSTGFRQVKRSFQLCARSSTMDGTPSIRVHSHCHDNRYRSPPSHSRHSPQQSLHAPASPMSIPHAAQDSPSVPPPLPPPTHLYEDLTPQAQQKEWNFFNKEYLDQHWTDFGKAATVRPGSSLLGGNKSHPGNQGGDHSHHHELDASRRGSSMSTVTVPHRNSEAMIDPCDSEEAMLSGYRCVILPSSSRQDTIAYPLPFKRDYTRPSRAWVAHLCGCQCARVC